MSELTGSNHRCRAQFKCAQTVVGRRFAGNGPNEIVCCVSDKHCMLSNHGMRWNNNRDPVRELLSTCSANEVHVRIVEPAYSYAHALWTTEFVCTISRQSHRL